MNDSFKDKLLNLDLIVGCSFLFFYLLPSFTDNLNFVIKFAYIFFYAFYFLWRISSRKVLKVTFYYGLVILFLSFYYYFFTQTKTIGRDVEFYGLKRFLSKPFQLCITFLPILGTIFIFKKFNYSQKKFLLLLFVFLFLYIVIETLTELSVNNKATRANNYLENVDIASYGYVYFISILFITMISLLGCFKKAKIILFITIILTFLFLIYTQYTLSIIAPFVVILYMAVRKRKWIFLILALLSILSIVLFPTIFNFILSQLYNNDIGVRIGEIVDFFSNNSLGYNLSARLNLYWKAIENFLRYPILGNSYVDFDGHATFLVVLSDLGLFGGIPFYWLYFSSFKRFKLIFSTSEFKLFLYPFLTFVLIGFVNPIHGNQAIPFAVYFISPLMINFVCNFQYKSFGAYQYLGRCGEETKN